MAFFGAMVVCLGLAGLASPTRLLDLVSRAQTTLGLWLIAALRIFLGIAFWLAADASRAPLFLKGFGVLAFLAGIATPLFGLRRFAALVDWWRSLPDAVVRAWSVLVAVLGASLVWVVLPLSGGG